MNATAVDLLIRLVAEQLAATPCANCSELLGKARINVRSVRADEVVVEASCAACKQTAILQVEPDAGGVARIA